MDKEFDKAAKNALKKAVRLMGLRIENSLKKEKEMTGDESFKPVVKNDELIKFADFMLKLHKRGDDEEGEEKGDGEIRFVLDEKIKDWAR